MNPADEWDKTHPPHYDWDHLRKSYFPPKEQDVRKPRHYASMSLEIPNQMTIFDFIDED